MNEDQLFLIAFLGFPLLLAVFLGAVIFFLRRHLSVACPSCGRRMPRRTTIADGSVPCPQCSVAQKPLPVTAGETCQACGIAVNEYRGLRLWDGHTYCYECVAASSGELARAAEQKDRLQDTTISSPWLALRNCFLMLIAGINAIFGTIFLLSGGWQVFLAIQLLFVPLSLVFAGASAFGYGLRRPIAEVRDGKVRVWQGTSSVAEFSLADCQWFRGSAFYVSPFIGEPGLLIVLPRRPMAPQEYAFVGSAKETREIWEAFFTLAGLQHRQDLERFANRKAFWLSLIGGVVALPVCFGAGLLIAGAVGAALLWVTGDRHLASMISFPLFVPGCIYMLLYGVSFAQGPPAIPASPAEQRINYWRMLLPLVVVNGMIVAGILNFNEVPWHARLAGVISNVTLALPVVLDLSRRFSSVVARQE